MALMLMFRLGQDDGLDGDAAADLGVEGFQQCRGKG